MIALDANILLFAANTQAHEHARAKIRLDRAMAGDEPVGFTWLTMNAFIRLSTQPNVFPQPLSINDAFDALSVWLKPPTARILVPGPRHLLLMRELLEASGRGGNLTSDADLAATAISYDAVVWTNDKDFARFPNVRWMNPLVA